VYTVEDELMDQARAVLSALAAELRTQEDAGEMAPVHVRSLIRDASAGGVAEGEEVAYLASIADRLERLYPIADLFPSKRIKWAQRGRDERPKGR
jgi:hypothetical protein